MCLVTEQQKPIQIRKDMAVYKVLTKELSSIRYYFRWELGKLYKTYMVANNTSKLIADDLALKAYPDFIRNKSYVHIHEGFHSFATLKRAEDWGVSSCDIIVKCTIPKGSLIYKDKTGLVVSNQIRIDKIIK